jgi:hypothetical protein
MGARVRESSERALKRVQLPCDERPTLIPCSACEGQGRRITETKDGKYRARICRWCGGKCFIDKKMHDIFVRWLCIYNWNRHAGACDKKASKGTH